MNLTLVIIGIIGLLILFGFISQIQLSYALNRWLSHVEHRLAEPSSHHSEFSWIQSLIASYKQAASREQEVNTQALIEVHFSKQPVRLLGLFPVPISNASSLLSYLPSFTIILGVLGTFIGLTESMFSMQNALLSMGGSSSNPVTTGTILSAISSPFKGMSLAFLTSIAGIGASLLLNLIQGGFLSNGQSISFKIERLLTELETLLDHTIQSEVRKTKPHDFYESILDRLAERIQESFQLTLGTFSNSLMNFTDDLHKNLKGLEALFMDFGKYREALTTSSNQLVSFGETFQTTTETYQDINHGMENQLSRINEAVDKVLSRVEQQEKRYEQQTKQMAQLLESSQKHSDTLSRQFLHALEQQMQNFHDKYDHAAETLGRQQEDWLYQHRDMNNQYAQGTETMVQAVEQLERSLIQTAEKLKRDILDQQKYQQERQLQILTRDQDRSGERDMIRFFDQISHGMDRGFDDQRRYYQEFGQLLARVASLLEQSYRSTSYSSSTLSTRVIDP
ncbi:hypothetical protein PU629_07020 [Pullulanibacillus sp. KACC 23026]|uniref:hypothetical protein n=1 Tax=Pullulanibacillus sp. KACC 23026 TaxID=3028315 RepID=UPI0023AEE304|nr:hypothetical protein [Pullulanibacillus sp. KACC 23026]WEG14111.1 hypothetical protein PU629_07020 [Pullulanibacillus sp. KACC 23026]